MRINARRIVNGLNMMRHAGTSLAVKTYKAVKSLFSPKTKTQVRAKTPKGTSPFKKTKQAKNPKVTKVFHGGGRARARGHENKHL